MSFLLERSESSAGQRGGLSVKTPAHQQGHEFELRLGEGQQGLRVAADSHVPVGSERLGLGVSCLEAVDAMFFGCQLRALSSGSTSETPGCRGDHKDE